MKYNRTLDTDDLYDLLWAVKLFNRLSERMPEGSWTLYHPFRIWEYSLALSAITMLDRVSVKTVLDVGAAGSLFPAMATQLGFEVTAIDPAPAIWAMEAQNPYLLGHIALRECSLAQFDGGPFDAVVAISVIEHVEDDKAFLAKLASLARRLVFLTTDFHGDGQPHSPNHLRTYNASMLWTLSRSLPGWLLTDAPDWFPHPPHVFDYNFASLCLVKD